MKLIKQKDEGWQYALGQDEAKLLISLLRKFPFTEDTPAKISRTDAGSKMVEHEKLLNESLAEHRKELQKLATKLAATKFKRREQDQLLTLTGEDREILLQILNDIRLGCWRALGEPADVESLNPDHSAQARAHHGLMNLAGYFEHGLIEPDQGKVS